MSNDSAVVGGDGEWWWWFYRRNNPVGVRARARGAFYILSMLSMRKTNVEFASEGNANETEEARAV